jgi:hypothetical protein
LAPVIRIVFPAVVCIWVLGSLGEDMVIGDPGYGCSDFLRLVEVAQWVFGGPSAVRGEPPAAAGRPRFSRFVSETSAGSSDQPHLLPSQIARRPPSTGMIAPLM